MSFTKDLRSLWAVAYWSPAAVLLAAAACGSSEQPQGRSDSNGDASPDSSQGASGGAMDGGGSGSLDPTSSGASGSGDEDVCEEVVIAAKPTIPDMMIVLDRSSSMKTAKVNRWDPSVAALKSVTAQLESSMRFGLMLFPRACAADDADCLKAEAFDPCHGGTLDVPVEIGAANDIAAQLTATIPGGGTPTGPTLDAALSVLTSTPIDVDGPPRPQYVILVTDGQPSCPNGEGLASATSEQLAADLTLAVQSIDDLKAAGILTYVIGYTEGLDPSLINALTEFAMHGGTNDYHTVQDEAGLVTELKKIAGEIVPCSYELNTQPDDLSYVEVKLDGHQLNLNDPDGWSINEKTVTLEGAACKKLQDGLPHQFGVKVLCTVVPII